MGRGYMKRAPTEADAERRSPGAGHALGLGELTLLPNRQLDMVAKSAVTIGDLGAPCDKMRATEVATRARSALGLVSHGEIAMAEQSESLHIDVDFHNEEIEVTLPPTNYSVTFLKSGDDEVLIAKPHARDDDARAPMSFATFLDRAISHANERAREFGWIV